MKCLTTSVQLFCKNNCEDSKARSHASKYQAMKMHSKSCIFRHLWRLMYLGDNWCGLQSLTTWHIGTMSDMLGCRACHASSIRPSLTHPPNAHVTQQHNLCNPVKTPQIIQGGLASQRNLWSWVQFSAWALLKARCGWKHISSFAALLSSSAL